MSKNKPFIITKKIKNPTLLPREYENFDGKIESQIRFIQTANSFISVIKKNKKKKKFLFKIGITYETVKEIYYHFAFKDICQDYSDILIGVILHNILWIIVSIIGIYSINSRSFSKIKWYIFFIVLVCLSRIGMYYMMYKTIKSVKGVESFKCNSVYQGGWYFITGSVEGVLMFVIFILMIRIAFYVKGL